MTSNPPEPIRKSLLPCTPPAEWEFHTVLGARSDTEGVALFPGDAGPVVIRRQVTYGGWEPVRPGRWAQEPEAAAPAVSSVVGQATRDRIAEAPAVWIDGHPQLEAIAAAVWERCRTEDTSLVVDDPRNIAVAALAAVLPPPAARATVLREAAEAVAADIEHIRYGSATDYAERHADLLHCLAGEAQQSAVGARQPDTQTQAHPPQHAWRVETRDPLADQWAPGSHFAHRPAALERWETANRNAPLWRDGTPVERRIVRETTTYTVEVEHQPAASSVPGRSAATDTHEETPRQSCACGQDGCEYCDVEDADEETSR